MGGRARRIAALAHVTLRGGAEMFLWREGLNRGTVAKTIARNAQELQKKLALAG